MVCYRCHVVVMVLRSYTGGVYCVVDTMARVLCLGACMCFIGALVFILNNVT